MFKKYNITLRIEAPQRVVVIIILSIIKEPHNNNQFQNMVLRRGHKALIVQFNIHK